MSAQSWFPNGLMGGGSSSSLYTNVFSGDNTGATDVTALFITEAEAAAAAGQALFIPEGDFLLSSTGNIILTQGQKTVIRGTGASSRLLIPTGSINNPITVSTLGEHDTGTANEITVTAVANLVNTSVAGLNSASAEVTKVTVLSSSGLVIGQMVSLIADVLITYARDAWVDSGGGTIDDQFNWQHEMARIIAISGNDIYLDHKLHYSATSYNGANYKALRYYPTETALDWDGFVFGVVGTLEDVRTTSASRPTTVVEIYGVDSVKWNVDFEMTWAGTVKLGSVIDPVVNSHVEYMPNGYSGGVALGYHGVLDGAIRGGKFKLTANHGGRHYGTTTWYEEAFNTLNNTGFVAGASTVFGYSTTGSVPEINDRIYIDMSTATGTINTMPVGTYLITNKVGATITVAYDSTAKTFTSGTGYGVLFQEDAKYRYGSVVGAQIEAHSTNALGALLDPHENAIDVVQSGTVQSSNGYTWSSTAGRAANTRGLRDVIENVKQKNCVGFISTDSFARQFNSDNTVYIRNISLINQSNNEQASSPYFDILGSSSVTDKRTLFINNVSVTGVAGKLLQYRQYAADRVVVENLNYNANTFLVSAIPTKNMITIEGGNITFRRCVFDFTNTTLSDYIRFLENTTSAATIVFDECRFINIPSPSVAPALYFIDMTITGSSITFKSCDISFTGAGTALRWLRIATGATVSVIYDSCNFTGMGRVSTTIGMAYGNGAGSVSNAIERNCTYDGVRHFKSNASATVCLASTSDINTTAVATTAVTTEETLMSRNFPANSLSATGEKVKFTAWGLTANNANVKTLRIKFGTATIFTRTLTTGAANTWSVEGYVITTGTNTQTYVVTSAFDGATAITPTRGTTTETATATIAFAVTGQNGTASASDITCQGLILEVTP